MSVNTVKVENIIIFFIWIALFMLVLPWDQEKIVVLNLIIFLYGLYLFMYTSLEQTFIQKKEHVVELINSTLFDKLKVLQDLIYASKLAFTAYSTFFLNIIKKYLSISTTGGIKIINNFLYSTIFTTLSAVFGTSLNSLIVHEAHRNILASKTLLEFSEILQNK